MLMQVFVFIDFILTKVVRRDGVTKVTRLSAMKVVRPMLSAVDRTRNLVGTKDLSQELSYSGVRSHRSTQPL